MEQQLSEATASASTASTASSNNGYCSWNGMGEESHATQSQVVLSTLQNAVREKERVISRLECQVEEQVRILFFPIYDDDPLPLDVLRFKPSSTSQASSFPLSNKGFWLCVF